MWWLIGNIFLLLAAGIIIYCLLKRYLNHKIEYYQSDLMDQHYTEVENIYRTMRGWRHDYHNHLQAMHTYAEMGQYEELSAYLEKLDESLYEVDRIVKTGNLMVDAILNSKLSLAREQKIKTEVSVRVPQEMKLADMDLCILIGNLLDNAIEASVAAVREEDRFLHIYMDILQSQLYLCITNGMEGSARKKGGRYVSRKRKGEMYGFGLLRVDNIVKKYDGFLNRQSAEGVFSTEVMLPL